MAYTPFKNRAAISGSETNRGTSVDYFPRNNIDPSVTPNTAPADDNSTVAIVAPSVTKAVTSLTSQAGNNAANPTNTSAQATIGETVRYTVVGSVPAKTSVYGATIRDTVSSRHSYVANSAKVTFPDGTIWNQSDGAGALPPGYTFTPGPNLVLKLPAIYQNTDPTAVAKFTVTFDVTVDNAAANNLTSATIANSGRLLENDSLGNALNPVNSNTTNVSVVEPKVTVTKANNAVDAIQGGDTVDCVAANDGQISHTNLLRLRFFNNRHALQAFYIIRKPHFNFLQKAMVDFIDQLHVARQHLFHQGYWPFFKSFGHNGMVGVAERTHCEIPSSIPGEIDFITKITH